MFGVEGLEHAHEKGVELWCRQNCGQQVLGPAQLQGAADAEAQLAHGGFAGQAWPDHDRRWCHANQADSVEVGIRPQVQAGAPVA